MRLIAMANHPPVWLLGFIAAAWGIAELWAPWRGVTLWPGWALAGAGLAVNVWAGLAFLPARTTILPHRRPSALVASGPYRFSRNPIYLGHLAIAAGIALVLGAPLALLLLVPYREALLRFFILPEEAVLEQDLGEPYRAYKARVRRWI